MNTLTLSQFTNIGICKEENKITPFLTQVIAHIKIFDIFPFKLFSYVFIYTTCLASFSINKSVLSPYLHCFVTLYYIEAIFLCH